MAICDYSDSGILQPTYNCSLLERRLYEIIFNCRRFEHLATPFPDSVLGALDSRPGGICGIVRL